MRIIDTHVHVWDLTRAAYPWLEGDRSILNQTWRIEQIAKERQEAGITSGILVQASGNTADTDLMLETAHATDWINGVVVWLPLADPEATQDLLEKKYFNEKYFKGARHQIHDEKNPRWLLQPGVIQSLSILAKYNIPYDIVAVLPEHIETALQVAAKIPQLRMVFDHLSQPPVASQQKFGKWGELMKEAAAHDNFFAKISGLGTASGNFEGRKKEDIKPYVAFALEEFGPGRCFCGGDWPVSMLSDSYTGTWEMYKMIIGELATKEEQQMLFYENANRFYNLS